MAGIELTSVRERFVAAEVCDRARSYGVLLRSLGDVVVWMPPLSILPGELEFLEHATRRAILDISRGTP